MAETKRTYETGTVTDRGGGKWQLRVSAGVGLGGKRKRYVKTVAAKNKREAERLMKAFIAEVSGRQEDASMTLSGLIDLYTEQHVSTLKPRTQIWYRDVFVRINAALGQFKLRDLKPSHIRNFYSILLDKSPDAQTFADMPSGLSAERVRHHHRALSAALNWAYQQEFIDSKVIDRVKPPASDTPEKRALTLEEIDRFLTKLLECDTRLQCFGILAISTGMRLEELCGLQWANIDLQNNSIDVVNALMYVSGHGLILDDTKNASSQRLIQIADTVRHALERWKAEQNLNRIKFKGQWSDFVFTTALGTPMEPGKLAKKLVAILQAAEIEDATMHTLRHTCATELLASGVPVNDVARYLGHASAKMTLDVYGHATEDYAKKCADEASRIFELKPDR